MDPLLPEPWAGPEEGVVAGERDEPVAPGLSIVGAFLPQEVAGVEERFVVCGRAGVGVVEEKTHFIA